MIGRRGALVGALSGALGSPGLVTAGAAAMPAGMGMPLEDMHEHARPQRPAVPRRPALLCGSAATEHIDAGYALLAAGEDTLQAALRVAQGQEDDPHDFTCGVSGLPQADGATRLAACCWHGPSRRVAAVAELSATPHAARVAADLLRAGSAPLLVGPAADRFARSGGAHGRLGNAVTAGMWAVWKRAGRGATKLPAGQDALDRLVHRTEAVARQAGLAPQWTWRAAFEALCPQARPLHVAALGADGAISCASTGSGLPWRMPGSLGDVAVPGAGSFVDPAVGSAGASGDAEANLRVGGARLIVAAMQRGLPPAQAGMEALRAIAESCRHDMAALRQVDIRYYVLRRDGDYACVSLWQGDRTGHPQRFTIHDGERRLENCGFLLPGGPLG